jgi:CRP/FNR family transcriptional regulator
MLNQEKIDVHSLFPASSSQIFPPRLLIIKENEPATTIYLIDKGELILERTASNGDRQITNLLFAGNIVGHSNHDRYHYSVQTITDVTARSVSTQVFSDWLGHSIESLDQQMRALGDVLLNQTDYLFLLSKKKAPGRVCHFLRELNQKQKFGKAKSVSLHMTRQDIADYLGLTSESVTRAFAKLKKDGLIDIQNAREITLLDPHRIDALADG